MSNILLGIWLDMLEACPEAKRFREAQMLFVKQYRHATNPEQGEFHRLLAMNHLEAEK